MEKSKSWQIIRDLESHQSRLNKEAIILAQGHDEFFEGCRFALDPMITFGLKQIPEKIDENGNGLSWDSFTLAIISLVSRDVTGNAARDLVTCMMQSATKDEWNGWYRRILIKDLRCGVSEKTINKVKNNCIPLFSCQLAHDSANHETKLSGKRLIEVKLDGVRVITIVYPDGRVDQLSRNGKELVNFGHVKEQFSRIAHSLNEPWVFDGEIMSSSFQDLMKQLHRKSDAKADDAVLNLFDCLSLAMFEKSQCSVKQTIRSEHLVTFVETHKDVLTSVRVVGQELVDLDTKAGIKRYKEINADAVAGGYEGIMIKDPDAFYECKRSVAWLKLKPFIEVSLEIKNVEEGTGKNIGRLGALVCEGIDGDKSISVNVGSGFTDSDRISFWNAKSDLLGHIVEVRADAITQNRDGRTYSLRFPRFIRFRGFVVEEKL